MPQESRATPNDQQVELQAILDRMVAAFNEFHSQVSELEKRQQDVVQHINARIDRQKLDQLKQKLQQM